MLRSSQFTILERASARETAGRVCAGTLARRLLEEMGITVRSHVLAVGGVKAPERETFLASEIMRGADDDEVRCLDAEASRLMREEIDRARGEGDSLGGIFEVAAYGLPAGLGSHVHWDRRLDARIAAAVMAIQAIKGVEIGGGFRLAEMRGSLAADTIHHHRERGFYHGSNSAGGIEGGMTNGEVVVVRGAMKPIPTLTSPLDSVDLASKREVKAAVERADVCAVPAAAVIAEAVVAFVLAQALLEKTGGDSLGEVRTRHEEMVRKQRGF